LTRQKRVAAEGKSKFETESIQTCIHPAQFKLL
jgi:hypothetical protein